jgi:glycine betaine/proline transport system permease protein
MEQLWQWINGIDDWIGSVPVPIGEWAKAAVDWLTGNFEWLFDGITNGLKYPIEGTADLLKGVPAVLVIGALAALAHFLQRSWAITAFVVIGLLFIVNQQLWPDTVETLVLVLYSSFVSLAIGIPIGIVCARRPWLYQVLSPVLDMMQTIPTFVYLVPTLVFFGLGMVPGMIATVIFVAPAPIRMTYLGISQVQKPLIEAGESFGCTRWQLLTRVKLPAALPTIMAGVTQTIMLSLSMVVIAALVGASGLGVPVIRALAQADVARGVVAGLCIVILAIALDRILKRPHRKGTLRIPKA